jgi:hypothetical protein
MPVKQQNFLSEDEQTKLRTRLANALVAIHKKGESYKNINEWHSGWATLKAVPVEYLAAVVNDFETDAYLRKIYGDEKYFACNTLMSQYKLCLASLNAALNVLKARGLQDDGLITSQCFARELARQRIKMSAADIKAQTKKTAKSASATLNKKEQAMFDSFWECYPNKKNKGRAEKAFKTIKCDAELLKKLLAAIANQKNSADWQKDYGQFVPHPATWLNAKAWLNVTNIECAIEQRPIYRKEDDILANSIFYVPMENGKISTQRSRC